MKSKARYLDAVSGKTPLSSVSSSDLAFDSPLPDIMTQVGVETAMVYLNSNGTKENYLLLLMKMGFLYPSII